MVYYVYINQQMPINKRLMKIYVGAAGFIALVLIIVIYSVDFKAILNKAEEEVKEKIEEVKEETEVKVKKELNKLEEKIKKEGKKLESKLKKKLEKLNAK